MYRSGKAVALCAPAEKNESPLRGYRSPCPTLGGQGFQGWLGGGAAPLWRLWEGLSGLQGNFLSALFSVRQPIKDKAP